MQAFGIGSAGAFSGAFRVARRLLEGVSEPLTEAEIAAARAAGEPDPETRKRFDAPWGHNVGGVS